MQARTALFAAIIAGTLAVTIVAADVAWGVEARLDARTTTGWQTIASEPTAEPYRIAEPGRGCAQPDMRLVVTNDKPWSATVDVRITFYNASAEREELLLEDTWSLDAFAAQTHTFRIPDAAFSDNATAGRDNLVADHVHVTAIVDDLWLSSCVDPEVVA